MPPSPTIAPDHWYVADLTAAELRLELEARGYKNTPAFATKERMREVLKDDDHGWVNLGWW